MRRHNSVSWHENTASKNNEPTEFDRFTYNNQNNRIFDILDRIKNITRDIQFDTEDVIRGINRLSNQYGSCYDYDDYLNNMKQILIMRSNELVDTNKAIINNIKENISTLTNKDKNLINDIEVLNRMLK
jgi:hypothetical protein